MDYTLTFTAYRDALRKGQFLGLKCNKCGSYTVPSRKVCASCGSEDMEIVPLSGKGKIQDFTVIFIPPEGYQAPYVVAMAELDEGPWVMGNVIDVDPATVTMDIIGRRVNIGYKEVPGDKISPGERIALTFKLAD
jgi:uncharacterized OB-fold protein